MLRKNNHRIPHFFTLSLSAFMSTIHLHSQHIPEKALVLDRTTCITFEEDKQCPIELPASCNAEVTKLKE